MKAVSPVVAKDDGLQTGLSAMLYIYKHTDTSAEDDLFLASSMHSIKYLIEYKYKELKLETLKEL